MDIIGVSMKYINENFVYFLVSPYATDRNSSVFPFTLLNESIKLSPRCQKLFCQSLDC